ncbi:MAG: capsular biosynthesis protein [Pigmentiphaga sp.]|nr:capsular biosynthesis protein [Pigmentiphaga sp.]
MLEFHRWPQWRRPWAVFRAAAGNWHDKPARFGLGRAGLLAAAAMGLWSSNLAATSLPTSAFYPFTVRVDALAGAPSASDLNQPLGEGSRLVVRQGHFATADGGGRLRLFGVNLTFSGNFPAPEQAAPLAKRLRGLGFNAVRLHHLDTFPGNQDPPASILRPGPFPDFNPEAIRRLRLLIEALAQEGIYTNLNLRVGYRFQPQTDGVPAYDDRAMMRPLASPIAVYHPRMVGLQEVYARELIERLGLRHNPALGMVEISNESSLLGAWHRREWRDAIPEPYGAVLRELWQSWLTQRYGSLALACEHWGGCDASARAGDMPAPAASGEVASTALQELARKVRGQLSRWRGHGVAAAAALNQHPDPAIARIRDFLRFLAQTDAVYFNRMRAAVQEAAGFAVPVTGTQMDFGGIFNLTSQAKMDYIDEHFYVDHPHFPEGMSQLRNWRIWNVSLSNRYMDDLLRLAFLRDAAKPFVVSELNHPYPSLPAAEFMPIVAAFASLQDWDGLFFFDYDGGRGQLQAPASFALRGDWGKYVTIAQVARLFREERIPALPPGPTIPFDAEAQVAVLAAGGSAALAATLKARFGLLPTHGWSHRLAIDRQGHGPDPWFPATAAGERSPGGTVIFERQRDVLEVLDDTMMGYFGPQPGGKSAGQGLDVALSLKAPFHAAILLSSLDGKPVPESSHLLLTLGSATVGSQPRSAPPRPKAFVRHPAGSGSWTLEPDPDQPEMPSASRDGVGPAWLTQNRGTVSWPTSQASAVIYPLDGAGRRMAPLPAERVRVRDGRLEVTVQSRPEETSPWYEIASPGP